MQTLPLHAKAQGLRQGGQAEAESTTWYVQDYAEAKQRLMKPRVEG